MWTNVTDPSDSWTDTLGALGERHTYGKENGETTRIVLGDNVRYGGGGTGWSDVTDPS